MKTNTLILFTTCFPYGNGETFLELEIKNLGNAFDKVIIVTPDVESKESRAVPENIEIIRHNFNLNKSEKLKALMGVFHSSVYKEIAQVTKRTSIWTKTNLSYLLITHRKSQLVAKFIGSILKERKLDVENVCLYSYWWLDEAIGISFFKKSNPEVLAITRCHGYDLYEERSHGNYLPFRNYSLELYDRIFPISDNGRMYILTHYNSGVDIKNRIVVSRLGVKTGHEKLIEKSRDLSSFKLVTCSLIYPNKRLDLLVKVLAELKFKVHWTHFGTFVKGLSEEYFNELVTQMEQLNPEFISVDMKGQTPNVDILDYYATNEIDLFLNLSQSEGIPFSIMEAMSYSIPVLATDVGGTSEIVNNENGILVPENITIDNLVTLIEEYRNFELDKVNKKRISAYHTFQSLYNAETNYQKFIQEIENIRK